MENRKTFWKRLPKWAYTLIILTTVLILYFTIAALNPKKNEPPLKEIEYGELTQFINDPATEKVLIEFHSNKVNIFVYEKGTEDGQAKKYSIPIRENMQVNEFEELLKNRKANLDKVHLKETRSQGLDLILRYFLNMLPMLLFLALLFYFMNRQQKGITSGFGFNKSNAKFYDPKKQKRYTFNDIAGLEEAKIEVQEIIQALKSPEAFSRLGARIPRGALFIGPPGTGKTLLAKIIAGEAGVTFLYSSASDFVELFVGAGAARIRDTFAEAKKYLPCILFVDELDAVAKTRGNSKIGGNDEREQTLNAILTEMGGFETDDRIFVIAATNRPDILDPALIRPGRFDRKIHFELPLLKDREAILRVHSRNIKLGDDIDLKKISNKSYGCSGADLENILNEAAILAARENAHTVAHRHLEKAYEKVLLGSERKSITVSHSQKKRTAVHEGGHGLVALLLEGKGAAPVQKISIIPRGNLGGYMITVPEEDLSLYTEEQIRAQISIGFGSYAAEHIIFGNNARGVIGDLEQVDDLLWKMVTKYGMSKLGPIWIGDATPFGFSEEISQKTYSEEMRKKIEKEIERIRTECKIKAEKILTENKDTLKRLVETLLQKEEIDRDELLTLVDKNTIKEDLEKESEEKTSQKE